MKYISSMEIETLLGRSIIPVSDGDLEKRVRSRYPPYTGPTTPKLCASVSEYTGTLKFLITERLRTLMISGCRY